MEEKNKKQIRNKWFQKNILPISCVVAVAIMIFMCNAVLNHIVLNFLAIMLVLASIVIFRKRMTTYIETEIRKNKK